MKDVKGFKLSDVPEETAEIHLDGAYEGVIFDGNISIPLGVAEDMQTGEMPLVIAGLTEVIKAWNLTYDDGKPIPVNPETIRTIPARLLRAMAARTVEAMNADVSTP